MASLSNPEGDDVAQATLAGLRDLSRLIGKRGPTFTPAQLDEMIRAARTLLTTLEFKRRLSLAVKP